jgi:hypothetical protein
MDSTLTKKIIGLDSPEARQRAIRDYRDDLLTAIAEGRIPPSEDLMKELAELNIVAGDFQEAAMAKQMVIARLTLIRKDGKRTIVEVPAGATFNMFYHVYVQEGKRWSTKRWVRTANRNEGLNVINAHAQQPGLEAVAKKIGVFQATSNPIVRTQIQIFKKRAYKRFLAATPESLGMTRLRKSQMPVERWRQRAIPVQLPVAERVAR